MHKTRLEAFSDGVIAIIITIMVLELKVPHGSDFKVLAPLIPVFFSYILSFIYVGIYWNNHHHMLHATSKIHGGILWANLHLLFWLSLIPFVTAWMGENHFHSKPVALYGMVLFMTGLAYYLLSRVLVKFHAANSVISRAIGKDYKGLVSLALYAVAAALAFVHSGISIGIYMFVAAMWIIPDRRIEKKIQD